MSVGWDATHGEFTIEDYYYFSKLKKLSEKEGIEIVEVKRFQELANYDVIVINYPEVKFRKTEIARIKSWVKRGKKVIFAGYYSNLDGVAENINRILEKTSDVRINSDVIVDEVNNIGDSLFPMARCDDLEVVMPCSASVSGGKPFVVGKDVFAAHHNGIIVIGTCVFWDNYSIELAENRDFAIRLLSGDF
jgi:hypothetical protein